MTWALNKLEKTARADYTPGTLGRPGSPGSPGTPAYSYWVDYIISSSYLVTTQAPTGYDEEEGREYLNYDGHKAYLQSISGTAPNLYYTYLIYETSGRTLVEVPAKPASPPVPAIPGVPGQMDINYNLGWNAGAIGEAPLVEGKVLQWRFHPGAVGAIVGVSIASDPQDQGYFGMPVLVMAASGTYTVMSNSSNVALPKTFTELDTFALVREEGKVSVVVNGAVVYEKTGLSKSMLGDSSLYSAYDVIWDAEEINIGALIINDDIPASTASDAVADATKIAITKVVGPGTDIGSAASSTASSAVAGAVTVDGTVMVFANATTLSDGVGQGYPTKTFGAGTDLGQAAGSTLSDGVANGEAITEATGGADLSFEPLIGAGTGPDSHVGWTGDFPGDSIPLAPLDIEAVGGVIEPGTAIGDCSLLSLSSVGIGVSGAVSVSSSGDIGPLDAIAAEEEGFSQGSGSLLHLMGYASDEEVTNTGESEITFTFRLEAYGQEALGNRANLRAINIFSLAANGGGHANLSAGFAIEATGTGESIGVFEGVIGYA